MTTEAEQLANELTEAVEGFPEPTRLESAAAALLRSQAAEIERLKAEAELLAKHVVLKLARKDALIRRAWSVIRWQCFGECRTPGVAGVPTAAEVDDEIKAELGE